MAFNQSRSDQTTRSGLSTGATGMGTRGVRDEQLMGERNMAGVSGVRTETTGQSAAFCPNPNTPGLAKEYETRVEVIEKVPEMKTITKTDYVKQIEERQETVLVPKTRVVMEEVERVDMVPHVREIPKTRTEIRHRVVEEQVEVPYTVKEVVNVPVPRRETVPRVVTEKVEEVVTVPVVREVPVQRQIEVPTGKYCEQPISEYQHAGKGLPTGLHGEKLHLDHSLINKEVKPGLSTPTGTGATGLTTGTHSGLGTTTGTTATTASGFGAAGSHHATSGLGASHHTTTGAHDTGAHKTGLLQKIENKLGMGHKH